MTAAKISCERNWEVRKLSEMENTAAVRRGGSVWRSNSSFGPFRRRLFRLRTFLGNFFYHVGSEAEYQLVRTGRLLRQLGRLLLRLLRLIFAPVEGGVARAAKEVRRDLGAPVRRVHSGFSHIRELVADERKNGAGHAAAMALRYLASGVRRYAYLGKDLLYYLLPLAAGAVFVLTVVRVLGSQFVLRVEYNDKVMGYVNQEMVYDEAIRIVQNQIVYTGHDQEWKIQPSFSLTMAEDRQLADSQMLVDAILQNSGAEIVEAVGLYVDDRFYGATTEIDQFEQAIESLKEPYAAMYPGAEIGFVQNLELREGVYLTESIEPYQQLESLLHQQVQGQRNYTVQAGDTPYTIAGANDITLADLYALNPQLENGNYLVSGMNLVIGQAVPFLQVKAVVTSVEQQPIAYEIQTEYTSNLTFGAQKVVQQGVEGQQNVTYETTYIDGQAVSKVQVGDPVVLSEPVPEVRQMGIYRAADGTIIKPGNGIMMFPIAYSGYKGMSRGYSGPLLPAHNGLDLTGYVGTPIYAAQSGIVVKAVRSNTGYGVHVEIDHGGGIHTLYGHCKALAVSVGQVVEQGDVIAYLGSTGWSTGPHCHFEVIVNGVRRDPMNYLG